ncbi:MarR family transcriptional regulator [Salinispora cortesiana]|uniref:MarR family transcriptional regulator n=1 Tax=Salinispora cortesiana TaxID=1305843 RepID=UPI000416563A|nr:MarR family transcriptional regulator [Salinispora cortesiana]
MTANLHLTAGSNEAQSVVAAALRRHPGLTARKLAGQENLPLPVVTEALNTMEATGTAIRTPGPTNGNRKGADLWEPTTPTNDTTDTTPDTADEATPAGSDTSGNAADAAPVSGVPVSGGPSGAGDHLKIVMVAGVLGDYPDGVSAADVIDQSGLRAQVVARVLTAMEVAGAAVRKPGDSDSAPERWVRGEADLATVDLANAAPYRECVCTCGHKHRIKTGVTVTATRRAGRTTGESNTDGSPKLGKNGLRNQVEALMRDLGPGHDLTPGTVGRELGGRSSGAVLNAMGRLAAIGVLTLASEAPTKYALADNPPAPTDEVAALMTRTGTDPSDTDVADAAPATT